MAYTLPGKKTKAFLEHCKTHFKHGLTYDLDAKRSNSRGFRPPAQIILDRAKGDFIWDLDGNKFLDFSGNGVGACSLGHANKKIDNAVLKAVKNGVMSTLNNPNEVYLAEYLISLHPWSNMARFARSGGEANAIAIRIARTFTDRQKIAICGYHGWHDWYLAANLSSKDNLKDHLLEGLGSKGVPRSLVNTIVPLRYNNFKL